MALHKHEPVSERMMEREYRECSLCQLLRETYRVIDNPEAKMNLRVAVAMAKAMDRKLREYKRGWDKGFWDKRGNK